ncbi:MAG: MoaD/ThiS family protein [Thermoplasmata archaeon]|nr:MoaD/ThiS family protein [Thermoplasmata archaeon]
MTEVRFDAVLREFAAPRRAQLSADNVEALIETIESRYPRLQRRLRDETGAVRRFIKIFVNGTTIEGLDGLATPLAPSDIVDILHSIQGG